MTRTSRVARNVSTTLITQAITWLLSFAVIFYLPRYAGDTGLGEITLAGSFSGLFALFSSLGLSTVLMRDIPRDPDRAGTLISGALAVRLPLAFVGTALGLLIGSLMGYSSVELLFIGISLFGIAVGVVTDVAGSAARGLETFSIANVGSLIDKIVASAITIIVCIVRGPLWIIVAANLLSGGLSAVYMLNSLRHSNIKWQIPPRDKLIPLVKSGLPFLSAAVFVAIYSRTDAIFLSKLSTIAAIGWYGLALRLAGAAMALPATVCSAMLPPLSAMYKENVELFIDGAERLINLMVICCIPIASAMIFCAPPLVGLLSHNAPAFRPAGVVVQVYGIAVILYFISQGAASAIIASDREKIFAKAMAVAAGFSIPVTAICVYTTQKIMHNGAVGAALSDVIPEIYLVTCYFVALPNGSVSWNLLGTGVRAIGAALPLIAEFYLVPARYVLAGMIPCIGVYIYLCVVLGCMHKRDVELFTSMVKSKIGRPK